MNSKKLYKKNKKTSRNGILLEILYKKALNPRQIKNRTFLSYLHFPNKKKCLFHNPTHHYKISCDKDISIKLLK